MRQHGFRPSHIEIIHVCALPTLQCTTVLAEPEARFPLPLVWLRSRRKDVLALACDHWALVARGYPAPDGDTGGRGRCGVSRCCREGECEPRHRLCQRLCCRGHFQHRFDGEHGT